MKTDLVLVWERGIHMSPQLKSVKGGGDIHTLGPGAWTRWVNFVE